MPCNQAGTRSPTLSSSAMTRAHAPSDIGQVSNRWIGQASSGESRMSSGDRSLWMCASGFLSALR